MKSSKFLSLSVRDTLKGLIVAMFSALVSTIQILISSGALMSIETVKSLGYTALVAGAGYLLQKWLRNSDGKLLRPENNSLSS